MEKKKKTTTVTKLSQRRDGVKEGEEKGKLKRTRNESDQRISLVRPLDTESH